jgi:hypothetical protein
MRQSNFGMEEAENEFFDRKTTIFERGEKKRAKN